MNNFTVKEQTFLYYLLHNNDRNKESMSPVTNVNCINNLSICAPWNIENSKLKQFILIERYTWEL